MGKMGKNVAVRVLLGVVVAAGALLGIAEQGWSRSFDDVPAASPTIEPSLPIETPPVNPQPIALWSNPNLHMVQVEQTLNTAPWTPPIYEFPDRQLVLYTQTGEPVSLLRNSEGSLTSWQSPYPQGEQSRWHDGGTSPIDLGRQLVSSDGDRRKYKLGFVDFDSPHPVATDTNIWEMRSFHEYVPLHYHQDDRSYNVHYVDSFGAAQDIPVMREMRQSVTPTPQFSGGCVTNTFYSETVTATSELQDRPTWVPSSEQQDPSRFPRPQ